MSKKSDRLAIRLPPGRAKRHGGWAYLVTGKLPEHRREVSRYLATARENLIRDLGPKEEDLTAGQLILIDRVITKLGVIRCMEEHIRENSVMAGNNLAPCLRASYLAYNNSVRLDLQALRIETRKSEEPVDLSSYIKAHDAKKDKEGMDTVGATLEYH